jgi:hypothetical protein
MVLKLADCAYARKITELNRSNPFLKSVEDTSVPESWYESGEFGMLNSEGFQTTSWMLLILLRQSVICGMLAWSLRRCSGAMTSSNSIRIWLLFQLRVSCAVSSEEVF